MLTVLPKVIVSANYLDRFEKDKRWLIRQPGQDPEGATRVKTVYATGVVFGASTVESGWRCAVVAGCETAVEISNQKIEGMQKLTFNGWGFQNSREKVVFCEVLCLTADGKMYYTPSPREVEDDEYIDFVETEEALSEALSYA